MNAYQLEPGHVCYDQRDLDGGAWLEKAKADLAKHQDKVKVVRSDTGYYTYSAIIRIEKEGEEISDTALGLFIDSAAHPYLGIEVERRRNCAGVLYASVITYRD